MPIEFHCSECYAQVITPDETAGKQGRCPHCSAVVWIPERNPAASRPPVGKSPASPESPRPGVDPFKPTGKKTADELKEVINKQFGLDQWEEKKEEDAWGEDTELSSRMRKVVMQERAQNRIIGPAQSLIVIAAVNLVLVSVGIVGLIAYVVYQAQDSTEDDAVMILGCAGILAVLLMSSTMIMIGANHMLRTRSYRMAYTGAVFALLPLNLLFFVSMPFGLWAILTLKDPDLAEGFKRH